VRTRRSVRILQLHVWFVYLGVALVLLVVCGIYTLRRLGGALAELGVGARRIRLVRWAVRWLLFGFPILMVGSMLAGRLLGLTLRTHFAGLVASWLLVVPFAWAGLVMLQSVPWLVVLDVAHALVRRRRGAAIAARVRALGVLAVIGVFALYTPLRIYLDHDELRIRRHAIAARADARSGAEPFRIAFLADIQQDDHTDAERVREIYALVNASQPDLVLSGGDWINTGPDHIEAAAAAAGTLKSRLGTYSVRGDHEHFAYGRDRQRSVAEVERALAAHGVQMLNNEVRWFEHHGKRIAVVFLSSHYMQRLDHADVEALVATTRGADYTIAVTHQLGRELAEVLAGKVDLVLGAHTHGGQVNPVLGITHVNIARLETEYVDGRYQLGSTTVIITAGVGNSLVPFRYGSTGSIELIELSL
jgi:predicted MPP superfamily phosphohydrolase